MNVGYMLEFVSNYENDFHTANLVNKSSVCYDNFLTHFSAKLIDWFKPLSITHSAKVYSS